MQEAFEAIYQIYRDEQLKCPGIPQEWCEKTVHFGQRWDFHHVVGTLDGKHVAIKCPRQSGSEYYNYKGFYSVVMLVFRMKTTGVCGQMWGVMGVVLMTRSSTSDS